MQTRDGRRYDSEPARVLPDAGHRHCRQDGFAAEGIALTSDQRRTRDELAAPAAFRFPLSGYKFDREEVNAW